MLRISIPKIRRVFPAILLLCNFIPGQAVADGHLVGKKIADFTSKITSIQYLEDRNVLTIQGDASGPFGTVGGTATFMTNTGYGASGHYSSRGMTFRSDGRVVRYTSNGLWKSLTKEGESNHRWLIKTIGLNEDGARMFAVGIYELEPMTVKGEVYELD